jgi:hypothetical protein
VQETRGSVCLDRSGLFRRSAPEPLFLHRAHGASIRISTPPNVRPSAPGYDPCCFRHASAPDRALLLFILNLPRPTGFEPVTSAFGEQRSRELELFDSAIFACALWRRNLSIRFKISGHLEHVGHFLGNPPWSATNSRGQQQVEIRYDIVQSATTHLSRFK